MVAKSRVVSGRVPPGRRSLHADLRSWVSTALWPQVVVGLYNGAGQNRLDNDYQ